MLGRVAPRVGASYIALTYRTTRWHWEGRDILQGVIDAQTPVIYAFWHSRILMMCPLMQDSPLPIRVLVSNNRDGEMISRIVQKFGQDTIRGSTRNPKKTKKKGGGLALAAMLAHLRTGGSAALTPDGPRGPRMTAQIGASALAAQTGLTIIPLAYSTSRGKTLKTWDRFLLAMPFGRGAFVVGDPIDAPTSMDGAEVEAHRSRLERTLTDLTHRADEMTGREQTHPADEATR